ncbi:unnamed protein product [Lymnaea stagnalis]|uniref:RNA helicase n=1 Tax=Lymnaea stagnalis TaxID=6523 RepID=A0AAV2GZ04_LYMST
MEEFEDLQTITESLADTFKKYLNPQAVVEKWKFKEKESELVFLSDLENSREESVVKLLNWVHENKINGEPALNLFVQTLIELSEDSAGANSTAYVNSHHSTNAINGQKVELKKCVGYILQLVNRKWTQKMSDTEWQEIIDVMKSHKFIMEKDARTCKEKTEPYEMCLELIHSIKRNKPEWPCDFINAIVERNPELVEMQQDVKANQFGNVRFKTVRLELPMHTDVNFPDDDSTVSALSSNTLPSMSDDWENEINASSHLDSRRREKSKFHLSMEMKNSPGVQMVISMGALNDDQITTEPQDKKAKFISHSQSFSDEEFESEEADQNEKEQENAHSNEQPSLNLRQYQLELAANALKGRNTIICAPTGSGKTRVAMHIILEHLKGQKENEPKRKVAFLARTVPLVMQQYKSIGKYLPKPYEVTNLTGESEDSMHLHMILPDNDVIVMTPRILENHFHRNCLPNLGVFSMLIFDECHHTRKGEPYNTLMYSYLKTKKTNPEIKLPQIVGLTASISVEKAVQDEEAVKCILKVCGNLDVDSISMVRQYEVELKETVPVPEEKMIKLHERDNDQPVEKILSIMEKLEAIIMYHAKEIRNQELNSFVQKIPTDKKSQQYGQWAVKIKNLAKSLPRNEEKETNLSVRYIIIVSDYLMAYNVALETHDLVQLRDVLFYLEKYFVKYRENEKRTSGESTCYTLFEGLKQVLKKRGDDENPNLTLLKHTLLEHLVGKGEKSCGIIFVRTRALTDALTSWLQRCGNKDLQRLKATVFTGTAASVDQGGMTQTEQEEIIRRFRTGDVRLLVATSVGEEGLDIPECNLVIKYNHVGNEVTTVQTRGRSRKEGGMSILLAMDKILRKERINQEKAKMMTRALQKIASMNRKFIRKSNQAHQEQIMKEEEILEYVKEQEESRLQRKPFKMVCHLCRKLVISSKDIKTILGTHRVVVDRNILKLVKIDPYKDGKYFDEVQMIGSVRCMAEPEPGKHCTNKLGSMMLYARVPFLVLGIKYFGFDVNSKIGLEFYNQWKKVPYFIDEIEPEDIQRYLPEKTIETNPGNDDVEDDDDDDDDDDGDGDSDDDEGNKPPELESPVKNIQTHHFNVQDMSSTKFKHSVETQKSVRSDDGQSDTDSGRYSDKASISSATSTTELKQVIPDVRHQLLLGPEEPNNVRRAFVTGYSNPDKKPAVQITQQSSELLSSFKEIQPYFSEFSDISALVPPTNFSTESHIGAPLVSDCSDISVQKLEDRNSGENSSGGPGQSTPANEMPSLDSIQVSLESDTRDSSPTAPDSSAGPTSYIGPGVGAVADPVNHIGPVLRSLESNDGDRSHSSSVDDNYQNQKPVNQIPEVKGDGEDSVGNSPHSQADDVLQISQDETDDDETDVKKPLPGYGAGQQRRDGDNDDPPSQKGSSMMSTLL